MAEVSIPIGTRVLVRDKVTNFSNIQHSGKGRVCENHKCSTIKFVYNHFFLTLTLSRNM